MIQISCVCAGKKHATYNYHALGKCDISPPSGRFISNFSQTFGPRELNRPTKFRSNQPPLTLSNRCSNFVFQWRPCFLRYANVQVSSLYDLRFGPNDQFFMEIADYSNNYNRVLALCA